MTIKVLKINDFDIGNFASKSKLTTKINKIKVSKVRILLKRVKPLQKKNIYILDTSNFV